jgi:hypothetical protein
MNSSDTNIKIVKVPVKRLKITLESNKEKHHNDYVEAMTGYKEALIEQYNLRIKLLRKELRKIKNINPLKLHDMEIDSQIKYSLETPEDHTSSYELAMDVADWTSEEELELSMRDFNSYVRDEWDWTNRFKISHSNYSSPNG